MANLQSSERINKGRRPGGPYFRHLWIFDGDGLGDAVDWNGGSASFGTDAQSTIGGGTVKFQWSPDETSWLNLGLAITSAAAPLQSQVVPPGKIRAIMTGSTTPFLTAVLG